MDLDEDSLDAARHNLASWINRPLLQLLKGDLRHVPIGDNAASVIISDPPWGEALGSRADAARLYRPMLEEMHRVLKPQGRLIIITQHYRALDQAAAQLFAKEQTLQVFQGGFQPHIIVYRRRDG